MDTLTLRNMQNAELGIMRVIDQFCRKHGISYSLYAGTAIGAVRYHGFIPLLLFPCISFKYSVK